MTTITIDDMGDLKQTHFKSWKDFLEKFNQVVDA